MIKIFNFYILKPKEIRGLFLLGSGHQGNWDKLLNSLDTKQKLFKGHISDILHL